VIELLSVSGGNKNTWFTS